MSTSDHVLELVQAMNRAKQQQETDEDKVVSDKIAGICQRYLDLINSELTDGDEINGIVHIHMLALAVSLVKKKIPYQGAITIGLEIGSTLLNRIDTVYRECQK
jgi:hypothetical protein